MNKRKTKQQESCQQWRSFRKSGSCNVLPSVCIFCDKQSKYPKGKHTRDPLRCCSEFRVDSNGKLLTVGNNEIVCSDAVTIENLLLLYLDTKKKLEQFEIDEQNIMTAAKAIVKKIKNCEYHMSWPPLSEELDVETFPVFQLLQKFSSLVLTDETAPRSDRYKRIVSSFSQDIFFAANQGKVLTPKGVLLTMLIKSLTNNTELVTTVSRFGHGVSYTKLPEIITEVAYSRINKNDGTVCLPEKCTKGSFTILVEDNIDRNEETLTGEPSVLVYTQ